MSRLVSALALLCALLLSVAPRGALAAGAARGQTIQVMVRLDGVPLAADTNLKARNRSTMFRFRLDPKLLSAQRYLSALSAYRAQEIAYIRQQGIDLKVGRQFGIVFNGFSATVPSSEVRKLRQMKDVAGVLPERYFHPLLDRSVPLINGPEAWANLGGPPNAGKGVYIADIDTGIDIKNPCFNDTGYPRPPIGLRTDSKMNSGLVNNKVVVARAFGPDSTKTYSADDASGHGTFTAAIEACDYNTPTPLGTKISGVAPDAYLMNYNVFPSDGSGADTGQTSDSQILAGIEAALLDGADVINLSLGGSAGDLRLDVETTAVQLGIKAGVNVVIAAGNAGPSPQTVASPATAQDAISVGAVTNDRGISSSLTVNGADVPASLAHVKAREGSHAWDGTIGPAPVVNVGLGRIPTTAQQPDGCPQTDSSAPKANDFAGKDLTGKIALIQRGILCFATKINNAAKAGAIGAVVYDNHSETNFGMDVKGATLPAVAISQSDGQALLSYIQSHPDATVTLDSALSTFPEKPDVVTDFSSVGYGANYSIKPDLVAPGEDIYSATQNKYPAGDIYSPTGFADADGTSFSAPHVTGAVALVLQKHPTWTPAMIKDALTDTANTNVTLATDKSKVATVLQSGSGMLNVGAAVLSHAYLSPNSASFGEVNLASGPVHRSNTLTLTDFGGGDGTWQVAVQQLNSGNGLQVTAPSTVAVAANNHVDFPLQISVAQNTARGDYDGYIELTHNGETLHVPYFIHVVTQAIKRGSVLLVDDTTSLFVPDSPSPSGTPTPVHVDAAPYYEQALQAIGKQYTLWNEGKLGVPSLQDLKQASAVIYFTGNNLNGLAPNNSNPEALNPPLSSADVSVLDDYMKGGGHVFVSGMGAALADPNFTGIVLGAVASSLSEYDNANNDKKLKGGISPPRPSAIPDNGVGPLARAGIFAGLKPIDFSVHGDGAKDNVAVNNPAINDLIGVPGLTVIDGNFGFQGNAYGHPALKTTDQSISDGGVDVGVVSSDEPTFTHPRKYLGRSVLFSFGFEGINNNTGYATRKEVMARIFQWFGDQPVAHVVNATYMHGIKVTLRSTLRAGSGARAAQYIWQIGNAKLTPTGSPTTYRFPRAGKYRVRVQITDTLGHSAVSPWTTVVVR